MSMPFRRCTGSDVLGSPTEKCPVLFDKGHGQNGPAAMVSRSALLFYNSQLYSYLKNIGALLGLKKQGEKISCDL